jgi:hypothetical protein
MLQLAGGSVSMPRTGGVVRSARCGVVPELEAMPDTSAPAPVDDEPITEEDVRRVREGEAWFAARGGKGIPMEEVLAEFGLTLEDFPLSE